MDVKRLFDICASLGGLTALSPLLIPVGLISRWKLGSPIFFTQERPGLDGIPFKLIKLRTMLEAFDKDGQPLPDSKRLVAWGQFLRETSLDELPTLWNVLKGDMSLVGPRPLLMEYLSLYNERQIRRHEVKPGITGWAQINGRNAISWEDKFELDVWYVEHQNFLLDLEILFKTLLKVVHKEGISSDTSVTMERFQGSK